MMPSRIRARAGHHGGNQAVLFQNRETIRPDEIDPLGAESAASRHRSSKGKSRPRQPVVMPCFRRPFRCTVWAPARPTRGPNAKPLAIVETNFRRFMTPIIPGSAQMIDDFLDGMDRHAPEIASFTNLGVGIGIGIGIEKWLCKNADSDSDSDPDATGRGLKAFSCVFRGAPAREKPAPEIALGEPLKPSSPGGRPALTSKTPSTQRISKICILFRRTPPYLPPGRRQTDFR